MNNKLIQCASCDCEIDKLDPQFTTEDGVVCIGCYENLYEEEEI